MLSTGSVLMTGSQMFVCYGILDFFPNQTQNPKQHDYKEVQFGRNSINRQLLSQTIQSYRKVTFVEVFLQSMKSMSSYHHKLTAVQMVPSCIVVQKSVRHFISNRKEPNGTKQWDYHHALSLSCSASISPHQLKVMTPESKNKKKSYILRDPRLHVDTSFAAQSKH